MGNYIHTVCFMLLFTFASPSLASFDLNDGKRPPNSRAPPPPAQPQIQPTNFTWALQWPNAFCYNEKSSKLCTLRQHRLGLLRFFCVHRLWAKLEKCNEEKFDVKQIDAKGKNKLLVQTPNLKWYLMART